MRALAEWIMQGRTQAIIATVLLLSVPLLIAPLDLGGGQVLLDVVATVMVTLAASAVGLVALRRGPADGSVPLMWGLAPALGWLVWLKEASPIVVLIGTFAAALVLRQTVSWSRTLAVVALVGLLATQALDLLAPQTVAEVQEMASRFAANLAEQQPQSAEMVTEGMLSELLLGGVIAGHLGSVLFSLGLARWWQSLLYNPGGFGAEFHQLRMGPLFAAAFVLIMVLGAGLSEGVLRWLAVLVLPFLMAGVALVHGIIAKRELGRSWLIAFYVSAFMAGPYLISLLILLAVADSFLHIRKRIPART